MAKQGAICWVVLMTMLCGTVAVDAAPTHPLRNSLSPDRLEQIMAPQASDPPLIVVRRERRKRRHHRRERRREWRHEARKEWRRERRGDAVAAGVGGLIIGGALGAAAASSQRRSYEQNIYNYPNYGSDYPYPR